MNRYEVSVLLGKVQLGDNRYVDELVIEYWHELLGDLLPLAVALEALKRHRRERPGVYLEPGHLIELAGAKPVPDDGIRSIDAEVLAASKARKLAAAGVTEEEFEAKRRIPGWIEATFPAELEAPGRPFGEDGEPE